MKMVYGMEVVAPEEKEEGTSGGSCDSEFGRKDLYRVAGSLMQRCADVSRLALAVVSSGFGVLLRKKIWRYM